MLARLAHFYPGCDPERLLIMPTYLVRTLIANMDALEAAEMQRLIMVADAPHLSGEARNGLFRRLEARIRRLMGRRVEPAVATPVAYDPVAAAEWFAAHGARVNGVPSHGQEDTEQETLPADA